MKAKKILLIFGIAIYAIISSHTQAEQKDRKDIQSCIDLTKQLKNLVQHDDLKPKTFDREQDIPLIDLGENQATSSTFFTDYDQEKRTLTLMQWPKEANTNLVDLNKSKKIAILKMPQSFENIHTAFFAEKILIITADQIENNTTETIALFYQIKEGKIVPLYFFKHNGQLIKTQLQNEKLYIITAEEFTLEKAKKLIKKQSDSPEDFPKISEGIKYGIRAKKEEYAWCQDLKYLFTHEGQLPNLWSMIVVDLNRLEAPKELLYFLWNFDQISFSKDFLYTSNKRGNGTTLIQRFGLDPKIHYQKAEILSGIILSEGMITEGSRSAFITQQESGKIKSYSITTLDEKFTIATKKELLQGTEEYEWAEYIAPYLFLKNKEKKAILIAYDKGKLQFNRLKPAIFNGNYHTFLINNQPLQFLQTRESWDKVSFSFINYDQNNQAFEEKKSLSYAGNSKMLWTPVWNRRRQELITPISIDHQGNIFQGIKGLQIKKEEKIKELFSRKYTHTPLNFRKIENLPEFTYIFTNKLIDIFIPSNPQKMKVFKN